MTPAIHFYCRHLIYDPDSIKECEKLFHKEDSSSQDNENRPMTSMGLGPTNVHYYETVESYYIDKVFCTQLKIESVKEIFNEAKGNYQQKEKNQSLNEGNYIDLSNDICRKYPIETNYVYRVFFRKFKEEGGRLAESRNPFPEGSEGYVLWLSEVKIRKTPPPDFSMSRFPFPGGKELQARDYKDWLTITVCNIYSIFEKALNKEDAESGLKEFMFLKQYEEKITEKVNDFLKKTAYVALGISSLVSSFFFHRRYFSS